MKSDSRSLTDLRTIMQQDVEIEEQIEEDEEVIPCSNISYVATADLFGKEEEDRPVAVYEDIDSVIPLPPPRTDLPNRPAKGKKSFSVDGAPPPLPPKDFHLDTIGRHHRRKKTPPVLPPKIHLAKSFSAASAMSSLHSLTNRAEEADTVSPYYVKKVAPTGEDDERDKESDGGCVQDTGAYEPIRSPSLDNEGDETQEPDVGGVDEYVMMEPVLSRAWETDDMKSQEGRTLKLILSMLWNSLHDTGDTWSLSAVMMQLVSSQSDPLLPVHM